MSTRPLSAFLAWLIWLCMTPLLLLAVWLAVDSLQRQEEKHQREAANLVKNFANTLNQLVRARINALNMLAVSPLADDPRYWPALYAEAQGFRESFGSHVIFANPERQMLFNTRSAYGTVLPLLPLAKGRSAAPLALETGQPQVGDIVFGPVAQQLLVAIAVPGLRKGKVTHLLLTTIETTLLQQHLNEIALPTDWSLALLDGTGADIARRSPPGFNSVQDVDPDHRFVAGLQRAWWTVVLEIPRRHHDLILIQSVVVLGAVILLATLLSVLFGILVSRQLTQQVQVLAKPVGAAGPPPEIIEIAAARHELDRSAATLSVSEARLRLLNATLEQRVLDRTAALSAANQELDAFVHAVSHDLRAPLRAMSGFSQVLEQDFGEQLNDEAKSYLAQIHLASRKMNERIDGLLALSRTTRGDPQCDAVDLSTLARYLLVQLAQSEPARPVQWTVADGLTGYGDARMLEAMLTNLLGNAWKYTARVPKPQICFYAEERGECRWFCVADNGAGFDMAQAQHLFKPFQRLHRSDEFAGIGIGLATVWRIVQRHGGKLEAFGAPGEGAIFCFCLPFKVKTDTES